MDSKLVNILLSPKGVILLIVLVIIAALTPKKTNFIDIKDIKGFIKK